MCRTSTLPYNFQAPIDASAIGLRSDVAESIASSSFNTAFKSVNSQATSSANHPTTKHSSRHPHIVVQHHYHDHANDDECIDDRPARGGVTTPFPIRLHKMLDKMEADGHADVISWQPHGRCFVVHKPKEFKELLPTYFKLSKMSSFQRQLNLYGFQRLTRGRDKNGYYHEYFLKGKPALSHKIQRTKVKGTGVRARSNPTTEPHLWEMAWVGTEFSNGVHHYNDSGSVSSHEDRHIVSPASPPKQMSSMPSLVSSLPAPVYPTSSIFTPEVTSSSWSQQAKTLPTDSEVDIVMSFEGKQFHYLDPEEMLKEALLRKRQQEVSRRNDMQAFISNLELDDLYVQLDDEVVNNDDAFMDMLERVIE